MATGQAEVEWKTSHRQHDALIDTVTNAAGRARFFENDMKVYIDPLRVVRGFHRVPVVPNKAKDLQKIWFAAVLERIELCRGTVVPFTAGRR